MMDFAPTPAYLPVTVTLSIPSRSIRFERIQLSTTDNLGDVKNIVTRLLSESKNPMTSEFTAGNIMVIRRPFTDPNDTTDEIIIMDANRPIVQYKIEQGSEIALKGDIELER
jgi:hypothetical protein